MDNNNNKKIRPYCAKKFGMLDEFKENIEGDIKEIKAIITNDIPHAIKEISDKVNKRPSWLLSIIITFLVGIIMFLLGIVVKIAL